MGLSISQMAVLSRLLDEALPLDDAARRRWLQQLPAEHLALADVLRESLLGGKPAPALAVAPVPDDATALSAVSSAPSGRPAAESPGAPEGVERRRQERVPRVPHQGPLRLGSVLDGRYTLIEELGAGGMGTVYKARDRNREEFRDRQPFIALKVLSEEFKRHPDARMALQRETVRAQSLAHPNIVTVYDFDYDGPHAYMTMELLEGQTLDSRLASEQFARVPFEERWQIVRSIGAGLSYAHEKGVVHSDLKPGNVFICKNGTVKVMDFGIARPLRAVTADPSDVTVFDAAERIGGLTPAYAALEQWNRDPPDPRDDIYAFACVVYFIFGGRHPFARTSAKSAFEAQMVPQRIDSLTRRQWEGLRRGLAFTRPARVESVDVLLRLLAPQTWLRKHRLSLSSAAVGVLAVLLYFGARLYGEYEQDQALNAQLWLPAATLAPLTKDQIADSLYEAEQALKQAAAAQSTDEVESLLLNGANNLHEILASIRQADPTNAPALKLTSEAAHIFAQLTRVQLQRNDQTEALRLVSDGQQFEHNLELLRLRHGICSRDTQLCGAQVGSKK
jgi:serine/threonine protein kinase